MVQDDEAFLPLDAAGSPADIPPLPGLGAIRRTPGALERRLAPGQAIDTGPGEPGGGFDGILGIVERGALVATYRPRDGGGSWTELLAPGDACGLAGLLWEPRPLEPDVRALVPSRVLTVPLQELWMRAGAAPEVARFAVLAAARSGDRARRRLASLGEPVPHRVLELLADLATRLGAPEADGRRIVVPMAQELIAAMVGATRESVNRALRDLRRQGRVRSAGRSYVVMKASSSPSPRLTLVTLPSRSSETR